MKFTRELKNFACALSDAANFENVSRVGWSGSFIDQPPMEIYRVTIISVPKWRKRGLSLTDPGFESWILLLQRGEPGIEFFVELSHRSDCESVGVNESESIVEVAVLVDKKILREHW
jgi:hypothetical protein